MQEKEKNRGVSDVRIRYALAIEGERSIKIFLPLSLSLSRSVCVLFVVEVLKEGCEKCWRGEGHVLILFCFVFFVCLFCFC